MSPLLGHPPAGGQRRGMSMTLADLQARGLEIAAKYDELNLAQRGRIWTRAETLMGFVGDVGDLAQLAMAADNVRSELDALRSQAGELRGKLEAARGEAGALRGELEQSRADAQARNRHHSVPLKLKIAPSTMKASALLGAVGSMNWGTKARKNSATFGFSTFVRKPCAKMVRSGAAGMAPTACAAAACDRSIEMPT